MYTILHVTIIHVVRVKYKCTRKFPGYRYVNFPIQVLCSTIEWSSSILYPISKEWPTMNTMNTGIPFKDNVIRDIAISKVVKIVQT